MAIWLWLIIITAVSAAGGLLIWPYLGHGTVAAAWGAGCWLWGWGGTKLAIRWGWVK